MWLFSEIQLHYFRYGRYDIIISDSQRLGCFVGNPACFVSCFFYLIVAQKAIKKRIHRARVVLNALINSGPC